MQSLQELRMRRIQLQEELARVSAQIDCMEREEYRQWQRERAGALADNSQRPGAIRLVPHARSWDECWRRA